MNNNPTRPRNPPRMKSMTSVTIVLIVILTAGLMFNSSTATSAPTLEVVEIHSGQKTNHFIVKDFVFEDSRGRWTLALEQPESVYAETGHGAIPAKQRRDPHSDHASLIKILKPLIQLNNAIEIAQLAQIVGKFPNACLMAGKEEGLWLSIGFQDGAVDAIEVTQCVSEDRFIEFGDRDSVDSECTFAAQNNQSLNKVQFYDFLEGCRVATESRAQMRGFPPNLFVALPPPTVTVRTDSPCLLEVDGIKDKDGVLTPGVLRTVRLYPPETIRLNDDTPGAHSIICQAPNGAIIHLRSVFAPAEHREFNFRMKQASDGHGELLRRGSDFTFKADRSSYDRKTGLYWFAEEDKYFRTWEDAREFCVERGSGWRLPTENEYLGLCVLEGNQSLSIHTFEKFPLGTNPSDFFESYQCYGMPGGVRVWGSRSLFNSEYVEPTINIFGEEVPKSTYCVRNAP